MQPSSGLENIRINRRATFWVLLGLHMGFVLFLAVWLFMAGISLMSFNDVDVFRNTFTWILIFYLLSYPLGLLVTLITSWVQYNRKRYKAALLWNIFPVLWIISVFVLLAYVNFS